MDWTSFFLEIDALLPEEKIRSDVMQFLEAVGGQIDYGAEVIVFPVGTQTEIEERMLVRSSGVKGGGYFLMKCALLPPVENENVRFRYLGKLKLMYDLEGNLQDTFHSRW